MFSKKHPVLFVSRNFIEPGLVTLSREPSFEGGEALAYTQETLQAELQAIPFFRGRAVSIVLAEELVYVAALSFPRGTALTRELVRTKAEETVPEDLRNTQWDFRTMRYVKHRETQQEIFVQVAVIERAFSHAFETILRSLEFSVARVLPESYVLASFTAGADGMTVVVEEDRENTLLVASEAGLVLATETRPGMADAAHIAAFLAFVSGRTGREIQRVVFSRIGDPSVLRSIEEKGYVCLEQEYNPLLGALFQKASGSDESVLNLALFADRPRSFWSRFFGKRAF